MSRPWSKSVASLEQKCRSLEQECGALGSPLWPSLATADPAKVTKYIFLVSCASANERSIQIKGDAKKESVQGGSCRPSRRRSGSFGVFWGGFREISGAGRAVRSKANWVWVPRSAILQPARALRGAGASRD